MKIIYIRETEETCDIIKRTLIHIRRFFNIIKVESNICYIPIFKNSKLSKHKIKRITNKINLLLEKYDSTTVALSEYLNSNKLFKNYLYSNNILVLDGRILFKCLTYEIIDYIFKIKNEAMELGEVSLIINDFTEINKEIIIHIAKNIKRLNIVTNHIAKCQKIEEYLYDEFGILLNISNNKKKSLLKSKIIINMDFPEELLNKYRIYDNAILININDKINLQSKRFNGLNINYYKILLPDEYKLERFQNEIVYESLIYSKGNYKEIRNKIKTDKISINKLIGNNGIIRINEII